ncbi:hypothetical protein PVBG_05425 [Plasmodium vivax Brazil I]|uniref:VIR protein n=1 Tax=Plasmodium vivax (strain Brazil I) TaxID=1033975 RepID=A0A0J9T1K4_PLAV1|nr:hypothetical protein PVBG_05425 [Plasmodium vivax Brazil I]
MLGGSEQYWKKFQRFAFSFSGELNSENYYDKLDNTTEFSKYFPLCNKLITYPNGRKVKIICAKLLKYLITNKILRSKDNEYDFCILLNYWVFNSLNLIFQSKYNSYIYRAFGDIELIWNSFIEDNLKETKNETCTAISKLITPDDWKYRKELYDYFADYNQIIQNIKLFPNRCEDFYEYIESKAHLYEHFSNRCQSSNQNMCPDFYKDCIDYDPKKVLRTLSCHDKMEEKKAALLKLKPEYSGAMRSDRQPEAAVPEAVMLSSGDSELNRVNSHPATKAGNILLGVVATSLTSGALYRFTPLGNMLRNGFGRNHNMRNFNGGDNGLFNYASESFNPYLGGAEEHYIGYHPA